MAGSRYDEIAAAIERLLTRTARLEWVFPQVVVEGLFMTLLSTHDIAQYLDIGVPGRATIQLSNALHDYRDSRWEDR